MRHPEIGENAATVLEEDVGRLDVAVDDSGPVGCFERPEQVAREREDLCAGERAAGKPRCKGLAAREIHDVVGKALHLAGIVHREDVGMPQAGQDVRFAEEPRRGMRGGQLRSEDLDRHVAAEAAVVRAKDMALPAGRDLVEDGVMGRQGGADPIQQPSAGHTGGDARRYRLRRNA